TTRPWVSKWSATRRDELRASLLQRRLTVDVGGLRYELTPAWRTIDPNRAALADSSWDDDEGAIHLLLSITVTNLTDAAMQVPAPLLVAGDEQILQAYEDVTDPALIWGWPLLGPGERRDGMALFRWDHPVTMPSLLL